MGPAGAAAARSDSASGWAVGGSPHGAQRDVLANPMWCPVAGRAAVVRVVEDRLQPASPLVRPVRPPRVPAQAVPRRCRPGMLRWYTPAGTIMTGEQWADPGSLAIHLGQDEPDRAADGTLLSWQCSKLDGHGRKSVHFELPASPDPARTSHPPRVIVRPAPLCAGFRACTPAPCGISDAGRLERHGGSGGETPLWECPAVGVVVCGAAA